MEAGERELKKAFEDVTTNNVKAVLEYSKKTREMLRDIEEKNKHLENLILTQNGTVENLRIQLSKIQTKVYSGGSVE